MSSDKTEQPSAKKLKDARKRGEIPRSKDLSATAVFIALLMLLGFGGPWFWDRFRRMVPQAIDAALFGDLNTVTGFGWVLFQEFALLSLLPLALAAAVALLVGAFGTGFLITVEPLSPKLDKLNPAAGFKRMFAMRNVIEVLIMMLKTALLGCTVYLVVKGAIADAVKLPHLSPEQIAVVLGSLLKNVMLWAALIYVAMAAIDYAHQHYQFMKENRMSKDELKREYKDQEGDPHVKGKRQQLFRDAATNGMLQRVRKATVIVVNPTHIAVAIWYDEDETSLPVMIAKGVDDLALRMREIAEEENIPILRNVSLARQLYETTPMDSYVSDDLLEPVAEVLKWVKRLHEQRASKERDN